ncbi:InlB B-repeat-containing protein [Treponema sp. OMZ 857]|uniref:InlB B-repeat-containing protein n=1 Tax=Treponema sp. OMZ 857 TaxID=1643513 RepID=UPI0020A396CC|nr:right-handed parallel beta-helix repeat-containing protein [Treponema sp. OMZ 857]UTC44033.1 hypothetical protein E4N66_08085 [Treponema sp. OMZ 857]
MKKVVRIVILSVLAFCLSIACKNYTADIEDYLSYWSAGVSIIDFPFDLKVQTDDEGMQCVSSTENVILTFTVRNPKNLDLKMPGDSDAPADIISFPYIPDAPGKSAATPQFGKDYTFEKISNTELKLTYTASFLKQYEWGKGDITPSIILYTTDGRVFKQNIPFKLKVNTPPPAIQKCIIGQTKTASSSETSYYVLCLQLPSTEMNREFNGSLLHKDIAGIEINGTIYRLSVNEAQHTFIKPKDTAFLAVTDVEKLEANAKDIPSDWTLYFKTDVAAKPDSSKKEYTVKLKDAKGLMSPAFKAATKPNTLQQETRTVTFNLAGGNIGGNTHAITMTGVSGTPLTQPPNPTKDGYTFNGWTPALSASPTFPAANMTYTAQWTPKTYTVTFKVDGGHGSLKGTHNGTSKVASGSDELKFESVPHNSTITFTATPANTTLYKVGDWTCSSSTGFTGGSGQSIASLTVTSNTSVSVQFVPLNTLTLTELKIHGQNASTGSVTLPYTITQVAQSNINLEFDGHPGMSFTVTPALPLALTPGTPQNITIKVAASPGNYPAWEKTVRITRAKNNVAALQSFKLNGEAKTAPFTTEYTVDSGTATVTDFTFGAGSDGAIATVSPADNNIPIGTGKSFTITVTAQDDTVKQTIMFTVKRRTYNVVYSVDGGVGGTIQANSGSPITTNSSISVEYDGSVTFTATPSGGWEVEKWMLDGNEVPGHTNTSYTLSNVTGNKNVKVKFKKKQGIIDGNTETHAWKELCERVAAADDGAVIMVKNIIAASSAAGNNGEIVINKNITIQGTNKTSEKLDAGSFSRIFRVKDGKTLTLQNITLTGGNTQHEQGDKNGGSVYIENGSCTMDNVLVVECTADAGGAVYVKDGTFSISGSTRITPSTGEYEQTAGKNDVYLKGGKLITVTGTLTGTTPIARITPESYPTGSTAVKVLDGAAVNTQHSKFTVTDQAGMPSKKWKINASGELEAVGGQSPAIEATSWEDLRTKVQSASDGTVIEVTQDITYKGNSSESTITINKNITIKSKGGDTYTLNADCTGTVPTYASKVKSIFKVTSGKSLILENVTLSNAKQYAVSVAENGSLMMTKVTIKDCETQDQAAGIYFEKGRNLTLTRCTIAKCKGTGSASSGGMYIQEPMGTVSIKNTEIKNCEAQHDGGGIRLSQANCTLENVNIQECSAANGGGIYNRGSTLTITGGSFIKNKVLGSGANRQGGAIYSEGGSLTLDGFTIGGDNQEDGNTAKKGGGIYLKNVVVTMQSVKVKNNKALTQGGGIYLADGELKIPNGTTIADNSATDNTAGNHNSEAGGGIYVEKGTLTLNGGIISGNSANANKGGGVYLKAGTFTMNSGEIKNCSAKYGGGVSLAGTSTFTMTGGTITGCKADVEGGKGGGIYTELKTKLTLEGAASNPVVISNCTAKETGGGMHIYTQNTVTVKNARIEGNSANSGGGVYLEQGTFTIAGSTRITPSTETTAGKNDVFLEEGKFITIEGTLTETGTVARITPKKYENGVKVLQASSTECAKFTVTPKGTEIWSINNNDGTLKKP